MIPSMGVAGTNVMSSCKSPIMVGEVQNKDDIKIILASVIF